MRFGQLASDDRIGVADSDLNLLQGLYDTMWSLVKDRQRSRLLQATHPKFSVFRPSWREAEEDEAVGTETRDRQSGHRCARAGDRLNPDPVSDRLGNQMLARIRNGRRSRIGHQRDALVMLQTGNQRRALPMLVVFVKARRRGGDAVPRQQMSRSPRIFCGDERNLSKDPKRPNRNVFEIADWRGDDVQRA